MLALDYASARAFDADGHLHVRQTNVSKAMVCPYYGHEIPGFQELGLDAHKVYHLLRDPRELEKAAHTFNGKPLLYGHNPVSAEDHDHERTVGSVSGARWVPPYLKMDLSCWSRPAIDGINDGTAREISASYRYTPVMTPGTYQGVRFDGRMTNLSGNHVALVPKGRAGPDVVVADAALAASDPTDWQQQADLLASYGIGDAQILAVTKHLPKRSHQSASIYNGANDMGPTEVETILKFLMSKLSESELAELDAQLAGEGRAENLASDARLRDRRNWLALDARARHGVRKSRGQTVAARAADEAEITKAFPHMYRQG
ncbi:DUF2213 domain-containing protein [Methylobacterium platani]|nr:DUF2213 domain-containing protein [Methylobacterium platani]